MLQNSAPHGREPLTESNGGTSTRRIGDNRPRDDARTGRQREARGFDAHA